MPGFIARVSMQSAGGLEPRAGAVVSKSARRSSSRISLQVSGTANSPLSLGPYHDGAPTAHVLTAGRGGTAHSAEASEVNPEPAPVQCKSGLPHRLAFYRGNLVDASEGIAGLEGPWQHDIRRRCCKLLAG